jgi:GntR family transcriptional regulator
MSVLVIEHVTMPDLDHDSAVPVYKQLAAILRERIADGTYQAGRRLPSVTGLTQEFGIAQLTARKALRVLVDEGAAVMSPGMGTYVKEPPSGDGGSRG